MSFIFIVFQADIFTLESYVNGSWSQIGTWERYNTLPWPTLKIVDKLDFRLQHIFKVATLRVSKNTQIGIVRFLPQNAMHQSIFATNNFYVYFTRDLNVICHCPTQ